MTTQVTTNEQAPIIGSDSNDYITVEDRISFQWVPDAGNSYSGPTAV